MAIVDRLQNLHEIRSLSQQRELARLTTQARDDLLSDFDVLSSELTPNQMSAIADNPWTMQLFFGTAVERRVGRQVRVSQSHPDSVFGGMTWTDLTNAPQDFYDSNGFGFDITGSSTTSIFQHQMRSEVDAVITYDSIPRDTGHRFIKWLEKDN